MSKKNEDIVCAWCGETILPGEHVYTYFDYYFRHVKCGTGLCSIITRSAAYISAVMGSDGKLRLASNGRELNKEIIKKWK